MKSIASDFKRGLETLDDLQQLGRQDILPLIQQAQYHFSGLKSSLDNKSKSMEGLDSVGRLLGHYLDISLDKYFHRSQKTKQLNTSIDYSQMSLTRWNRLIDSLPSIVTLAEIFSFQDIVTVTLKDGFFKITGRVYELDNVLGKRCEVYSLFRNLCQCKVLTTYNIQESRDSAFIELIFDLRESDELVYAFAWKRTMHLGLSHIFADYRQDIGQFIDSSLQLKNSSALFYRITEDFRLEKFDNFSLLKEKELENCELLHFPFLFRSLSLIIPRKGRVALSENFRSTNADSVLNTGCGVQNDGKQDVSASREQLYFIDFFKLVMDES